jgi:hypothetical protein
MLVFDGLGGLFMLGLWIFCFIDVILTPDGGCRNLPKLTWVFIVLLLPDIGSIAWLVAGRPWNRVGVPAQGEPATMPRRRYEPSTRTATSSPDDDEEFLAGLRKRAEEQRRKARELPTNDRLDGDKG